MRYIILAAGFGKRLNPLTDDIPKCLFKLDSETTVINRTIDLIYKYDETAVIRVVAGYRYDQLEEAIICKCMCVRNPLYSVTNSIVSLWLAIKREDAEDTVIINGDVVMDITAIRDIITQPFDNTQVLVDSSRKNGDYKVQVDESDNILVMGKDLGCNYGEYAGVTMLKERDYDTLKFKITDMINNGHYDQWYENALVHMILQDGFKLKYRDILYHEWSEIDCMDDLIKAQIIHKRGLLSQ
jgi:choline kinase